MDIQPPCDGYTRKAEYDRAVDGDTVDVLVDLGYKILTHQRLRLGRVDTPELNSKDPKERDKAKEAKKFVAAALAQAKEIVVRTEKTGKYGRYIAEIWYTDELSNWKNLSDVLLQLKLAKEHGK